MGGRLTVLNNIFVKHHVPPDVYVKKNLMSQRLMKVFTQNEISRVGTTKGSFSLNGYKTNSRFAKLGFRSFEIIYKLSNPETLGYESIRLKNCRLKKLPLINSKAGEIVKIEVEGSFRGYDLLNEL